MNNYTFKFKINNPSSEERKSTFEKIKNAYPNKLPIICEKHPEFMPLVWPPSGRKSTVR